MMCKAALALLLAGCVAAAAPAALSQAQDQPSDQQKQQEQKKPGSTQQQPSAPQAPSSGNPFPGDVNSVPVMPSGNGADYGDIAGDPNSPNAAPPHDTDPVHSPEGFAPGGENATDTFSSSRSGIAVIPDSDLDTSDTKGKKGADSAVPQESATEDVEVGNYYLDNKNWRGALSRFQSAMVLAPDNPDVYWGLAECYRHLGQYADARANYQKVVDYDPDSKHGKESKKALKEPEIANASVPKPQK